MEYIHALTRWLEYVLCISKSSAWLQLWGCRSKLRENRPRTIRLNAITQIRGVYKIEIT